MSRIVARAESWERAYEAFQNVNFAAFDYNTVKQSLLEYIKLYFPETFTDYIESSEFIAIIEVFAYLAEVLSYRLDINAHENFISTAQRKDSILRLAKLVSYSASRPLPARGLVKITSVSTTESIVDANGTNLSGQTIRWNDTSNSNWKDQFITIMNRVLEQDFGTVGPRDRFQIQDVLFELYSWNLIPQATGVFPYTAAAGGQVRPMELVPVFYDPKVGITERRPRNSANFTILYGQDGIGDASDTTGFFCFTKQGTLQRFRTSFDGVTPNQTYDVAVANVNDTDVWVNAVYPETGMTKDEKSTLPYRAETLAGKSGEWVQVDLAHSQNVIFNTNPKRNKYEVETRADNKVRLLFGDGEFADIPSGTFDIWVRSSVDADIVIPQTAVSNQQASFAYVDRFGQTQTFTYTFSLVNSLQNASAAEDIEHIRTTAPAVYYSQDRMVNGEDHNVFMLQDPSILKLRATNRTFAGDSKYINWHDSSGSYENVKIYGNDGILYFAEYDSVQDTPVVTNATLISTYIEPLLSKQDIYLHAASKGVSTDAYRRAFNVAERSSIEAALTPPPTPTSIELFYNFKTYEWRAIKTSSKPPIIDPLGARGYEERLGLALTESEPEESKWKYGEFFPVPLIAVFQTTSTESRYSVTHVARNLIFHSPTTSFWDTNGDRSVIDYDTLQSAQDTVTILQGNVNYNRSSVLVSDWLYNVKSQATIEAGAEAGLTDIHRLVVTPEDENDDGVPDNIITTDHVNHLGISDIMSPKFVVDVPPLSQVLQAGDYVPVMTFKLPTPVMVMVDANGVASTPDVDIFEYSTMKPLGQNYQWGVAADAGTHVTDTITLYRPVYTFSTVSGYIVPPIGGKLLVKIKEYVYFSRPSSALNWTPVPTTSATISSFVQDAYAGTSLWKRYEGRGGLNFAWYHHSPRYFLVDPAPSNIIDSFIITKGYYNALRRWLEDASSRPTPPTPLDLRTSYGYLLDNKMISDTVVLRPGSFKLLFGNKADPALRATFKVVRSADRTLTDNQIKTIIVTTVRNFFDVSSWEFGETFYFTELAAAIHTALPTEISSVVLVPTSSTHRFGDLFQVPAREDEVLHADMTAQQIEIVSSYTALNLQMSQAKTITKYINTITTVPTETNTTYCDVTYCDTAYISTLRR